ncbi:MAG: TerC family protein [Proteobacteria bacterium]|nr:TerC family protein [Pseudomonadota bacterium]HQR03982.1 TerC family protein [Rhodocyclaceae bacterium]
MEHIFSGFSGPWVAILQIIAIDLVLSGDNAVVIALACRNLPAAQRRQGVFWGVVGAVGLRVVLTAFAATLLGYPYLKLAGGVVLLWIGVKLMLPEQGNGDDVAAPDRLWAAVRTVITADLVMSIDNVIAVAAAARDSLILMVFGLAVSIPLIVWSAQWVMWAMERWPFVVAAGAGLLGYVGGEMAVADPLVVAWLNGIPPPAYLGGLAGAVLVVGIGWFLGRRTSQGSRELPRP